MRFFDIIISLPRVHKIAIATTCSLLTLLTVIPTDNVQASKHTKTAELDIGVRYPLELRFPDSAIEEIRLADETDWETITVKRGDTLASIFKRVGLSAKETYLVTQAGELAKTLVTLLPNETIDIAKQPDGRLKQIKYQLSPTQTLFVNSTPNGDFTTELVDTPVDVRTSFAHGEIKSSFWNAGVAAGLPDNLIMRLAGIFGWDIDFAMEIREGDTFNLVFEEQYINGEFVGYGDILAAEFVNKGEQFTAIMYTDGNYYTPEGRSMRKSFLRAPVNFRYVSSNFSKARFHPVQKRWKAHRGTDYAAPVGTPVLAAGDGKVIRASYDKYNGHHVFIQHGEKYTTKYLHFKKRAVKKGDFVKQGQTIGYLGATGMVTGAHLHYEFLVDGVHRNPRTVTLPKALPIDAKEKSKFQALAIERQKALKASSNIMLAMSGVSTLGRRSTQQQTE